MKEDFPLLNIYSGTICYNINRRILYTLDNENKLTSVFRLYDNLFFVSYHIWELISELYSLDHDQTSRFISKKINRKMKINCISTYRMNVNAKI